MLIPAGLTILISSEPTDMRKAIDGLSILAADQFDCNPISSKLFVFRNKQGDKVKILYWDTNGFCLWYKRLEKGRFIFPPVIKDTFELTARQLRWLLEGLDFSKLRGHKELHFDQYY